MQKKKESENENPAVIYVTVICAEISAIPNKHCILSCKLMFKGSFVLIESVDCQVAYSTLNYSKNEIISHIRWHR